MKFVETRVLFYLSSTLQPFRRLRLCPVPMLLDTRLFSCLIPKSTAACCMRMWE